MGYRGLLGRIGVCGCWLGAFALYACSGSSGSDAGSCNSVAACGGDIVGTWKIQSSCQTGYTADSGCPTASVDTSGLTTTGTITFGADSTVTTALTLEGSLRYNIPSSCLTVEGQTATCAQLGTALMQSADATFSSASCQQSGSNCVCTATFAPQNSATSGTYSTSGSTLTVTTDGQPETDSYCATSTELHLSSLSTSMDTGMMGTTNVTQVLVAIKQ